MKLWTKLGLAALALGVIVVLVLAGTAVPAYADHIVDSCSDIVPYCQGECPGDTECLAQCIAGVAAAEGTDLACDETILCEDNIYTVVCAELAEDPGVYAECIALFSAACPASCSVAHIYTPEECAANTFEADDGGEGFCCSTCAGIPGCDVSQACTDTEQCFDYCISGGFNGGGSCGCGDDRVNQNCSAPEIVYCDGDSVKFYAYNYATLEAELDFTLSMADLQQSVEEKTLIKQDGTVKVYLMPDGRVLLVARQPDGKDYFMYWNPDTCLSLEESAQWNVQ